MKKQINIRIEVALLARAKERSFEDGITLTGMIESGLKVMLGEAGVSSRLHKGVGRPKRFTVQGNTLPENFRKNKK